MKVKNPKHFIGFEKTAGYVHYFVIAQVQLFDNILRF